MEATQAVASTAGNGSDALVKGLKRRRSIAWCIIFALFFCPSVLAIFGFRNTGPIAFLLRINYLMQGLTLLYVMVLGFRIRRAESKQVNTIAKSEQAELMTEEARIVKPDMEKPSISNILLSQILPPLLMLPLFVVPWDLYLLYWIICGLAALIALSNLLGSLSGLKRSNPSASYLPAWNVNLRSLLTVVIFTVAVAAGFAVERASGRYAEELAARLQRACKERGRCLHAPEGWRAQGNSARSNYGHWSFTYVTNAEQSEFGLWIHMRNEAEKCIHGGSTIPLSEIRSLFCNSDPKAPSSRWQYEQKAGDTVNNLRKRL